MEAKNTGRSVRTIKNLIKVGHAIIYELYPEDIMDRVKNKEISYSELLSYLIKTDKKEKIAFRCTPELKFLINDFKDNEGYDSTAQALRVIISEYLLKYFKKKEESSKKEEESSGEKL